MPLTAFAMGTWQVKRLERKTEMVTKFEDRILRPPLPLPPTIDPAALDEFDYRRIYVQGYFRHDQEMLLGPRIHDGKNGFLVVTPLEREGEGSKILVKRGWISKDFLRQKDRLTGLPTGAVVIEGLLRKPSERNMFSPKNDPESGLWHFPDVAEMAAYTGSSPVWIEETMSEYRNLAQIADSVGQNLLEAYDRLAVGKPIGRVAAVDLRNNHLQYIFTWYAFTWHCLFDHSRYSLSAATAVMFWMVMKKPPSAESLKVRGRPRYS